MKELMLDTNIQIDKISRQEKERKKNLQFKFSKLLKHSSIESETPSRSLLMSVSKETEEHGDLIETL
ncbi:hypothetical protein BpHYR1_054549 [Brachionus plicatilis]|uniref:Uncharacterized protein n=1 Tax=Brachionus plicatilis TaxID=10195 RepID=A0A3M7SF45_BRAPC|nr:hypothetical protein BpHYR1_054549 [Brachionus plicatilis]